MKKVRAKDTTGKRGTKFDVIKPKGILWQNLILNKLLKMKE